jgi:ribosomal-protein-alanine N-acetyltransferase
MPGTRLEIITERLAIRELDSGLAHSVHAASLDGDNRRFMPDEVFETEEDAVEAIKHLMAFYGTRDGPLVYAISLRDGIHIGHVEAVPIVKGNWEVGYHITKGYTGKGYATEAVAAFIPVILRHLKIDTIYGICGAENAASCHVLEKCGFSLVFEGVAAYHGKRANIRRYIYSGSCTVP